MKTSVAEVPEVVIVAGLIATVPVAAVIVVVNANIDGDVVVPANEDTAVALLRVFAVVKSDGPIEAPPAVAPSVTAVVDVPA
jgi:hypothetical protein